MLLGSMATVAFGFVVLRTQEGSAKAGTLGQWAVEVAAFPGTAKGVLQEIVWRFTGELADAGVRVEQAPPDLAGFAPVATARGIDIEGLFVRVDEANAPRGWRLLVGGFALGGEVRNAALLLSPDLEIVQVSVLDEVAVGGQQPRPAHEKFPHGVARLPDQSTVFTFDGSISLQRFDRCGERLWAVPGEYHHAVTAADDGASVWTLRKDSFVQVAVEDGTILREFSAEDVIRANPDVDILEIRRKHPNAIHLNSRDTEGRWLDDPFHFNDVDPLPAALDDAFAMFDPGDLLISARSLNLVFVVDPDDLRIKWWRAGEVTRQHDPDWQLNGEITVFNNRMSRDASEIVAIDPGTMQGRVVVDGRDHDFYTRIRGKHAVLPDGHMAITSAQQGRAFEVDDRGDVVLEFLNLKPGDDGVRYVLSELQWLGDDSVDRKEMVCAS